MKKESAIYRASTPKVEIKVVGFLDFNSGIVYPTKEQIKESETRQHNKTFIGEFAAILKGIASKGRVILAKKLLKAKYSFKRYIDFLNSVKALKSFNLSVHSYLRVYC